MIEKTNEEIYKAYLLGYACHGDSSKAVALQDVRPVDSAIAAAMALAERDRQANESPDTWESLRERMQAMFDGFDPNGSDLLSDEEFSEDEDEDDEEIAEQ